MGDPRRGLGRTGILYPLLIIAALAVTVFGVLGVVSMTGVFPRAESMSATRSPSRTEAPPAPSGGRQPATEWRSPKSGNENAAAKSGASCCEPAPHDGSSRAVVPASTTL